MKVHQIVITVIDFDELGADAVCSNLVNQRFSNDCINLSIRTIETKDIGPWSDNHLLNQNATVDAEMERLFPTPPGSTATKVK